MSCYRVVCRLESLDRFKRSAEMPEGDTIFRAARTLHRALAGKVVTRFESVYPAVTRVADDHPIVGRTIESVAARGKHLLMTFSGDLLLHTHMRMNGSWHIYPAGARWQRPARDMRVVVGTADAVAVGFNVPIAELLTPGQLARHKELQALGPDLLDSVSNRDEILRRLREHARDAIGDALLNQRVVAGIGNVFKSEVLFLAGLDPFAPVAQMSDADLERLITIAREQLAANVMEPSQTLHRGIGRRTTRSLDPNQKLWVYGHGGKPCRRCGTILQAKKTGFDARLTYWCPRCQPPSSSSSSPR
jgi:endonuclease-8